MIEARLQQIEAGSTTGNFDIVVKSIPAQPFLALRRQFSSIDAARATFFEMQRVLPPVVGEKNLGHFTVIMHNEGFTAVDADLQMGFMIAEAYEGTVTLSGGQKMTMETLPEVETMVTSVQVGPLDMSHPCRAALASWVESHGYEFAGHGREVFITPPLPGKEHETVLEIQHPVFKQTDVSLLPSDASHS